MLDTEEKISTKKLKTEDGNNSLNLRYDGDWAMVFTDGACPNNGKAGARAGIGVWWNYGHKLNVSERIKGEKQTNYSIESSKSLRGI